MVLTLLKVFGFDRASLIGRQWDRLRDFRDCHGRATGCYECGAKQQPSQHGTAINLCHLLAHPFDRPE
jgi:hypothetical protein